MKAFVTLRFEIELPDGLSAQKAYDWAKDDAAGFILARPRLRDRFPYEVIVTTADEQVKSGSKAHLASCGHKRFGAMNKCTTHECPNNYAAAVGHTNLTSEKELKEMPHHFTPEQLTKKDLT